MRRYKHSFDEVLFKCRWSEPFYHRHGDWTIIGIHKHFFSSLEYEYRFCFFGFEVHIWMKRE